jgi:hypothetical protein
MRDGSSEGGCASPVLLAKTHTSGPKHFFWKGTPYHIPKYASVNRYARLGQVLSKFPTRRPLVAEFLVRFMLLSRFLTVSKRKRYGTQ